MLIWAAGGAAALTMAGGFMAGGLVTAATIRPSRLDIATRRMAPIIDPCKTAELPVGGVRSSDIAPSVGADLPRFHAARAGKAALCRAGADVARALG